ncbi:hypothetical protein [Helicobacter turcicus]|uniref:Uncharacterized protein n=1 Tax=Helicobacter turcicus TaxID=2867412 RepID=A0ABS7JN00_9HELI|nr:hypothetical protein [Helicobacter turcicus]MBX7490777.1 hypothetical protein [Helicobacter turcicus]MBX7545614.1 hypothetical protein [Helicobacter turcicus]
MLATKVEIESALKALKECQKREGVTSCILCAHAQTCNQKEAFANKTQENLNQKQEALKACQKSMGLSSCGKCAKILECTIRNSYVSAVYLSMNKGNGGSFEF